VWLQLHSVGRLDDKINFANPMCFSYQRTIDNCSGDVLHLFFTPIQSSVYEHIISPLFPEPWAESLMRQYTIETGFWTQAIPDASEKDVSSWNQTHAPKKRTGRMLCAYSFMSTVHSLRSACDILNLTQNIGKWLYCKIKNKPCHFLVAVFKN